MITPHVSVVMPVLNGERYVADAIESVLAQSFQSFEFVVIDDGSTDRSGQIVAHYAKRDDRIKAFPQPHRGIVDSLNTGIAHARGEFIARMDADDICMPGRLQLQADYLVSHPDCVAIGCGTLQIDEDGAPIRPLHFKSSASEIEHDLFNGGLDVLPHPGSMIRKSAMLRVGGYRSEYQHVEDFDLWLRLIDVGRLSNLPETLLQYRQHPSSVCFRMGDVQKGLAIRALREARSRRGYSPDTAIDFCGMPVDGAAPQLGWAVAALGAGYRATALKHTRRALRTQPMSLRAWTILAGCVIPTALTQRVKASKPLRALSRWLHSPAP